MSVFENAELWRRFVHRVTFGMTRSIDVMPNRTLTLTVRTYVNHLQKRLIHCTFTIKDKMSFTCALVNNPQLPAKFHTSSVVLHGDTTEDDVEHYMMLAVLQDSN